MDNHMNIEPIFTKAISRYTEGNYEESVRLFSDVLSGDPAHKLSLISRGSAHLKLGETDSAMTDFDTLIDLHPDYARAYHLRGLPHEQRGEDKTAVADFDRAIELDPGYGAAYASRAVVHQKLGNDALATEDMSMLTSLTQVNMETFANENNIWQTHHMRVEDAMETELNR
ncbi:MAG: tetratricopeptide repeat protein [Desulfobacteraceae bacterium]|nr:tetratricopeptide repeat protein [Desulfobacteraceae bacterium]